MNYIKTSNELYHYGMPRRSGRYPYGSGDRPYQHGSVRKKSGNDLSDIETKDLKAYNNRRKAEEEYRRWQKKDQNKEEGVDKLENISNISNNVNNAFNNTSQRINDAFREEHRKQKSSIDLSNMSDDELRRIVNRMNLERQYRDLAPTVISDGEKRLNQVMSVIGPTLSTTASVLAIAVAIKKLMIG